VIVIRTASGSERVFIKKLIDKDSLATARGTDSASRHSQLYRYDKEKERKLCPKTRTTP
jgi:hypothetical protein